MPLPGKGPRYNDNAQISSNTQLRKVKDMTAFESLAVPTRWTLEDALTVIRPLQAEIKKFHYHLCLGGGVLNKGYSEKDLDLYFMPLDRKKKPVDALIQWLEGMWGPSEQIGGDHYPEDIATFAQKRKFQYGMQRIDVFIVGDEKDQQGTPEEAEELGRNGVWRPPAPVAWPAQPAEAMLYRQQWAQPVNLTAAAQQHLGQMLADYPEIRVRENPAVAAAVPPPTVRRRR